MKYKAIFFDMDGTLLPMDNDLFIRHYFSGLSKRLAAFGLDFQTTYEVVMGGTVAMMKNDGSMTNEEAFWNFFEEKTGLDAKKVNEECLDFYRNEFADSRAATKENPLARVAVDLAHEKAEHVVLATNPIFPVSAQHARMSWIGLSAADFELFTCYETSRHAKPNPAYYLDLLEALSLKPEECLMIGNDEKEDMYAAGLAGIDGFLVTDCLLPDEKHPYPGPRGSFEEMIEFLRKL